MITPPKVYRTDHKWSINVCNAFAAGCNGDIVKPYPLQPGDVAVYGCMRGLLPTLEQAWEQKRRWYYIDNGYFKRGHENGFYRVTVNALQHDGSGNSNPGRWERLKLSIDPWRKGKNIIVCPPSRLWGIYWDFSADKWLEDTVKLIKAHTDRPIIIRRKMSAAEVKKASAPLSEDLKDAHLLVTHSSNAAVEALLAGVPVFCTNPCAAYEMGIKSASDIEKPFYPENRYQWACNLAARQWNLKEMQDGTAWREILEAYALS